MISNLSILDIRRCPVLPSVNDRRNFEGCLVFIDKTNREYGGKVFCLRNGVWCEVTDSCYPQREEEISTFLKHFHEYPNIDDAFTKTCSYWFAYIMKERFNGEIMYDPVYNHFMCQIANLNGVKSLYDITGDVTKKYNAVPWVSYDDESEKIRIIREYIMFELK